MTLPRRRLRWTILWIRRARALRTRKACSVIVERVDMASGALPQRWLTARPPRAFLRFCVFATATFATISDVRVKEEIPAESAVHTFCGSWSVHIICLQPFVSNMFEFGFLFVYPPAHTKMRVTRKSLQRARAPNQLSIFLEREQLFGVDDVALVCTKKEHVS